jgi:hypothetical protein
MASPKKIQQTVSQAAQQPIAKKAFSLPPVRILVILLAVVSFLIYANTLHHGYVLDDMMVVQNNGIVHKGFAGIGELLSTPYLRGYIHLPNDNYRPLSLITLAIENQLLGEEPGGHHFMNVLWFAGCVVVLFLFLFHLFERNAPNLALAVALLFAVHPVHTEVVANIKSRDELLCFFFSFSALLLLVRYLQKSNPLLLIAATLAAFLALLSKETAIILVVLIPVLAFTFSRERRPAMLATMAGMVAAGLFLFIRHSVLVANHANDEAYLHFIDNQLLQTPGGYSRLATEVALLGRYVWMMVLPNPLVCSYAYNSLSFASAGSPSFLVSVAIYAGLAGLAVYRLIRFRKDGIALGIAIWLGGLAVVSNIFILIGSVFAERFLFLPSAGFFIAVILGINWVWGRYTKGGSLLNGKLWVLVLPVSVVLCSMTVSRNADWKDNYTLFTADVQKYPDNARLNYYIGNEMSTAYADQAPDGNTKAGILKESIPYLQKAVAVYPHYSDAQTSLGTVFFKLQQYDSAEVHHKQALADDTLNILAINGLAGIYFMKQDFVHAKAILIRDVAINPRNADIVYNLGSCYLNLRQYDSAVITYRRVLALNGQHQPALKSLAQTYTLVPQLDSARKYEAMARLQEPGFSLGLQPE